MSFYAAMAFAAYVVELVFGVLRLTPAVHATGKGAMQMGFAWDYTTWFNLIFLIPAVILFWRFMTTGGPKMMKMMERPSHDGVPNEVRPT